MVLGQKFSRFPWASSRFRDKMLIVTKEEGVAVKYDRFFNMLNERNTTPAQLAKEAGVSGNIITRIRRDEYVSMESIEKICAALDCKVDDILEFNK